MRLKKRLSRLGITIALLMIFSQIVFESSVDAPDESKPERKIYLRVTLGEGYEKLVHIHVFVDRFREPWADHYAISKDGLEKGLEPSRRESLLKNGEQTPWCDITEMTYHPEQGARLVISPAYIYSVNAATFNAVLEFATSPSADAVVKTIHCHHRPSILNVLVPGDLNTPENIAKLKTDREISEETGAIADTMTWPTIGEAPALFPFFVTSNLQPEKNDLDVLLRELRTLRRFGFNGVGIKSILGGLEWNRFFENFAMPRKFINGNIWLTKGSFSSPDVEKMKEWAGIYVKEHKRQGLTPGEITYCNLMDEPVGESPELLSQDESSIAVFRDWLRSFGKTPADLLVNTWDEVRTVTETERETKPALFYFTQRFRTHILGKFMEVQKEILFDTWQARFPVAANFSDGAIYYANFYSQGVDYFELLHGTNQNSIWGEDWANISSTFQCGAYNAQLMHAAARKHGQLLGSYLITCDGRKALDIKLKAIGLVSRGVKMLDSFYYGPAWGGHEKGMWLQSPDIWYSVAEVVREIGAVEEWLLEAQPKKAETALLYSSASDIWTLNQNHAFGFDACTPGWLSSMRRSPWISFTKRRSRRDF